MRPRLICLAITLLTVLALAPGAWAAPTTFVVDSIGDAVDVAPGNGACATSGNACTLRAAIQEANATTAGLPYTVQFNVSQISVPSTPLPTITQDDVFIDGCGVGRADFPTTDAGPPNEPVDGNCSGLIGTGATVGLQVGDATSDPSDVAIYNLAMTNFPSAAIRVWGADRTRIAGNLLGRRINGQNEGNGAAIRVTGRTQDGTLVNAAMTTVIGSQSNATSGDQANCDLYCNTIVNSTTAGIDLVGKATSSGPGDEPAGGGAVDEGTTIAGNWIGVYDAAGSAAPNAIAVKLGDSLETSFGTGSGTDRGNVIAGNTTGIDQGPNGTSSVAVLDGNLFGVSPDGTTSVPNGLWNARLGGTDTLGGGAFIQNSTFGPAAVGLELTGPRATLVGNAFTSPDSATFTTAAVHLTATADNAFIGSNIALLPICIPLADYCNTIGHTGPGAPGIWVDGADNARIWRNAIGDQLTAPIPGPPIRIGAGAVGADIGDNDDDADRRNWLRRTSGPAIEVQDATKIVIGDNEGLAVTDFGLPSGLFTDLLPTAGPGNSGTVNNGIQPPDITVSSTTGVGGTGIPGARVNVLLQEGPPVVGDPDPRAEGTTYPPSPSVATVGEDGIWGIAFPTPLKQGIKLLASQTTTDGTSEYASPQAAAESNPPPVITFQSGPTGVVDTRSATFTFSSNKPGTRMTCSVDAGAFVPCTSPFTLNGLDIGGHQLQVKGTDPTGKVGAPASRTWIVQIPEPVSPGGGTPPPATTAGAVKFASVVSLPSARACVSRRTLRITVRVPKGATLKSAEIRLGKRKVRTLRKPGRANVSLKGLPRGAFVVKVKVTLTDGRTATGSRAYRTCAKKTKKR